MTLGPLFRVRRVRILHRGGTPGDQRVLTVVNGMREGIGEHEVNPAGHAAANGEGGAVVDARGRTLEDIDRPQLRNRTRQRIDARRKRAGQRLRGLKGREGLNVVVRAQKIRPRRVVHRIRHVHRRRQDSRPAPGSGPRHAHTCRKLRPPGDARLRAPG